eukprot:1160740-Pelagomonas_calceolata.AAC.8
MERADLGADGQAPKQPKEKKEKAPKEKKEKKPQGEGGGARSPSNQPHNEDVAGAAACLREQCIQNARATGVPHVCPNEASPGEKEKKKETKLGMQTSKKESFTDWGRNTTAPPQFHFCGGFKVGCGSVPSKVGRKQYGRIWRLSLTDVQQHKGQAVFDSDSLLVALLAKLAVHVSNSVHSPSVRDALPLAYPFGPSQIARPCYSHASSHSKKSRHPCSNESGHACLNISLYMAISKCMSVLSGVCPFPSNHRYAELVVAAELISYYDVSGCYILRPSSYAMWEVRQIGGTSICALQCLASAMFDGVVSFQGTGPITKLSGIFVELSNPSDGATMGQAKLAPVHWRQAASCQAREPEPSTCAGMQVPNKTLPLGIC